MTPKEKANELIDKHIKLFYGELSLVPSKQKAKMSTLITLDEIIKVVDDNSLEYDDDYWQEVKKEIENL